MSLLLYEQQATELSSESTIASYSSRPKRSRSLRRSTLSKGSYSFNLLPYTRPIASTSSPSINSPCLSVLFGTTESNEYHRHHHHHHTVTPPHSQHSPRDSTSVSSFEYLTVGSKQEAMAPTVQPNTALDELSRKTLILATPPPTNRQTWEANSHQYQYYFGQSNTNERTVRRQQYQPIRPYPSKTMTSCTGEFTSDNQTCEYCQKHYDTPEGYFKTRVGDLIASRYYVNAILGQGTFGTVLACSDASDPFSAPLAIKIIRNIPKYRRAARTEIQILDCLRRGSATHRAAQYCIRMEYWFEYLHHICMVFPLYKMDIYNYLERNHFQGFPIHHIQSIGRQLLVAVAYMHQLRLIHTDIKPENILLKDDAYTVRMDNKELASSEVLLIDFGSAIHEEQYHGDIVSTRHYRAPEIILGLGWSYPCDVWSIGCVLYELFRGTQLFSTHDNLSHLATMEAALGHFPLWMIRHAEKHRTAATHQGYFSNLNKVNFPTSETPAVSVHAVKATKRLDLLMHAHECLALATLHDLIHKCLKLDPHERITAQAAIEHPFFTLSLTS